jgi:hypothetical protein
MGLALKELRLKAGLQQSELARPALLAFPKLLEITEGLKLTSQSQANDK